LPKDKYYDTFKEFQLVYRSGDVYSPELDSAEPLNVMCRHFIDCMKNNKTPRSDGLSSLRVIKIIEAAQQSLKENGKEIKIE
jgi:predicted dehydrogenase